jgi:hypothetical protein
LADPLVDPLGDPLVDPLGPASTSVPGESRPSVAATGSLGTGGRAVDERDGSSTIMAGGPALKPDTAWF